MRKFTVETRETEYPVNNNEWNIFLDDVSFHMAVGLMIGLTHKAGTDARIIDVGTGITVEEFLQESRQSHCDRIMIFARESIQDVW